MVQEAESKSNTLLPLSKGNGVKMEPLQLFVSDISKYSNFKYLEEILDTQFN